MTTATEQKIVFNVEEIKTEGPITFPYSRSKEPFPPIVQSFFESGSKQLEVSAIILLPYNQDIKFKKITTNDNPESLEFYIDYLAKEKETAEFKIYQVTFYYSTSNNPGTVKTYLRDEDPVTSRGTVTTVQS